MKEEIDELYIYGIEVFNDEKDKFFRWLNKPNISLNNKKPLNLLNDNKGIKDVYNCLDRINYGNF